MPGHREAGGRGRAASRAQLIRVLFCEIGRILNHLLNVTTQAMDVGALTPPLWGFEEREKLMHLLRARLGRAAARQLLPARRRAPGPAGELIADIVDLGRRPSPRCWTTSRGLITGNRIFKQRNVDIGVVTRRRPSTGASPA